jgi:hypothetical protein
MVRDIETELYIVQHRSHKRLAPRLGRLRLLHGPVLHLRDSVVPRSVNPDERLDDR